MSLGRVLKWGAVGLAAAFVAVQALPFGRSHTNPAEHSEPSWDSPRTAELAAGACYACHSNRTEWPWYSHVAPISWLVERDVYTGRDELSFSEPQELRRKLEAEARKEREKALERARQGEKPKDEKLPELLEVVLEGEMPPWYYAIAHPSARLSDAERRELARGLAETFDLEYEG